MNIKGNEIELLYREADAFRKEAHDKWLKSLSGKYTISNRSQDYVIIKTGLIMDLAFDIEKYSMLIQGRPFDIDPDEVRANLELIKLLRSMM
ncbi:hypothetical protein ACFLW9_02580 [Chloroflexota bacterium]